MHKYYVVHNHNSPKGKSCFIVRETLWDIKNKQKIKKKRENNVVHCFFVPLFAILHKNIKVTQA